MIWEKKSAIRQFFKKSWNQSAQKVTYMIWQNLFLCVLFSEEACLQNLGIDLEAKRMDGISWKKNSIISVLTLFVAA